MKNLSEQFNEKQLIHEFKAAVADAEALLEATANTGGEKLAEIRARVEESLGIAKASIMGVQDEVLARTHAVVKATDVYVHENPWRSIGFAASLGIVVGLLIGRR